MTTHTTTHQGPGGNMTPGNARDRARFDALTPDQQEVVRANAADLYDGTRTVARCWTEALEATESP